MSGRGEDSEVLRRVGTIGGCTVVRVPPRWLEARSYVRIRRDADGSIRIEPIAEGTAHG